MTAERPSYPARLWRRLSFRERLLAGLTFFAVLSALSYQYPYLMLERSVSSLRASIPDMEKEIFDLTVQAADLKARVRELKAGGAAAGAGKVLSSDKGAVMFLEDVSAEARRLGVNLISVHPSQEVDKEAYKEISMNMDLKARYRELGEYFQRLEGLARVVNIRKLRMEACPDSSSVCAVQIEAVTYTAK